MIKRSILLGVSVASFVVAASAAEAKWMRASFYSTGTRTSSGERFRPNEYTAAHRTLPFGTELIVCHYGKCVACRVNDRGPFKRGRELDLSLGAARRIGMTRVGVVRVKVTFPMPKPKPPALLETTASTSL